VASHLLLWSRSPREGGEACPTGYEEDYSGGKEDRGDAQIQVRAKTRRNPDDLPKKDDEASGGEEASPAKGCPGFQGQEEVARFPSRSYR